MDRDLQEENEWLKAQLAEYRDDVERFRLLQQVSQEPVAEVDEKLQILWVNEATLKTFKTTPEELEGRSALDFVAPESRDLARNRAMNDYQEQYEITLQRSDGSLFPGLIHGKTLREKDRAVRVLTIQDISKVKEQQEELIRAYNELDTFFSNSMIGVVFLRNGRLVHKINDRMGEILGYSQEEVQGKSVGIFHLSEESFVKWGKECYQALQKREIIDAELQLKHKEGFPVWVNISGKALDTSSPPDLDKGVIWILNDISRRKAVEEEILRMALTDPLTNIRNRRHFLELAGLELERQKRDQKITALLMLDIDYFKNVNDIHGHQVGDETLIRFVEICKDMLRSKDIFGRLGGEEFAVLLPETDDEQAMVVAERIRVHIETETKAQTALCPPITVSIGVATAQGNGVLEDMISTADRNLYQAKRSGRNRVVCN